jgi:hypothetical protein
MPCNADMIVHFVMTAGDLRRQVDDITLTVSERTEKIVDAMQNLLMARAESAVIEGSVLIWVHV